MQYWLLNPTDYHFGKSLIINSFIGGTNAGKSYFGACRLYRAKEEMRASKETIAVAATLFSQLHGGIRVMQKRVGIQRDMGDIFE